MVRHALLLATLALAAGRVAIAAPPALEGRCARGAAPRTFSEGDQIFPTVALGWTRARLLALLGPPTSCEGQSWIYVAGPDTGPQLTYRYEFVKDRLTTITHHTIGCRVVQ